MATEVILRKRASTRAGEIGLFCDVQVWEEEFAAIKSDTDVKAVVSQPRSLKQHKFAWALATKVAEACDWLETKDDAMEYILIEAKHCRLIYDPLRQISYARAKPTNWGAMDGVAYTKLLKRMTHVVGTHIVPGIDQGELKAEIEKMLNPDLIPTGTDMPPEPPPIDSIPDGPGAGHNSRPAGIPPIAPERAAAGPAPSYASSTGAGPRPATPEPPVARETASPPGPSNGTVWTVDMPGTPDWSKDQPGDAGTYFHYAMFHIERKGDLGLSMGWLQGDQQWELRRRLGIGLGVRKQLERHAAEHYGKKP